MNSVLRAFGLGFLSLAAIAACGPTTDTAPQEPISVTADPAPAPSPSIDVTGAFAHADSDLPVDDAVAFGVLENGMRYAVLANDTPTDTAALRLHIDMGSVFEAEDQRGLAHYIEHMAFNGTENIAEDELVKTLERYGLAFGADTNAYTSFMETVYQLDLPTTDAETVDVALTILREMSGRAVFDAEAIDRERGVILSEERTRNTFQFRYFKALYAFMYPQATLSQRFPIGLTQVIETAERERFVDLYERYYTPERATLVAVGDFDAASLEAEIQLVFGDWTPARPPGPDPDLGAIDIDRGVQAGFFSDPDMYTLTTIAVVRPAENRPDTAENRRRSVLANLGSAVLNRRLTTLSRQPDAPFLQASAGFGEVEEVADEAALQIVSEPDRWRDALTLAEQELRRALEFGFTEAELAEQIAILRTSLENAVEQAGTRETPSLADAIVGSISGDRVFTHPDTSLERFLAYADTITPEAVLAEFREGWSGSAPLVFLATNAPMENAEAEITAVYEASRSVRLEPPVDTGAQEFAYTDFGPPGIVAQRTEIADLGVTTIRFENGVALNVKPTDFEDGVIRVRVRVGAGRLELPTSAPGLELLFDEAFMLGGLAAHSTDELQSMLAGRTVGASATTGGDAFVLGGRTNAEDLDLQLQLLTAALAAPGFREEAEAQFRQYWSIVYETLDAAPSGVRARDVPKILRSGDPRFGIPPLEDITARDFDELAPVLTRALTEGAIEIAIVGDVTVDAAAAAVAATFGALPQRLAAPEAFAAAREISFPAGGGVDLEHQGEPDQAAALIYWPTTDDSDADVVRRLNLLQRILDLKLIERVRERDGATYSPQAFALNSSTHPGFGYLGVSLELQPADLGDYFAITEEIAAALAAGEITEDELERARRPLLEALEERTEDNAFWLGLIAVAQTKPEYLDRHREAAEAYSAVTIAELAQIARAYLDPERALRIAIRPSNAEDLAP